MKKQVLASLVAISLSPAAFAQDDEVKPFTMEGELGFISTSGNTETTSISAGIQAHQELEKWSNDYVLKGLYKQETVQQENDAGEQEDIEFTSAQKFFGSAQGNYKLENPDNRYSASLHMKTTALVTLITNQLLRRVGTKKYLRTSATPLNIQSVLVTHSSKLRMAKILTA